MQHSDELLSSERHENMQRNQSLGLWGIRPIFPAAAGSAAFISP
jgi:hypothetical protein